MCTEWSDKEGRPQPKGLGAGGAGHYGLSGRLAKVIAANTLGAAAQDDLAIFPSRSGGQRRNSP